jgi:hypothetical protein
VDLTWSLAEVPGVKEVAVTPAARSSENSFELKLDGAGGTSVETIPPVIEVPVSLVLDDASAENYIGLNDGTFGYQFIWLNRFTPVPSQFPFNLTNISVVLGATGVAVGDPIDLVVYEDTDADGDPSDATWLATYNVTVQFNDGLTWNVYPLTSPLLLSGPGDVLIGAINRYQVSGVEPADFPAALDLTATQQRSWVGAWSGDPPNPAILPPDAGGLWGLIDAWYPGNWMVRGYGETVGGFDVPWLSETPTIGTLGEGESVIVSVTFDSTAMDPGDYFAGLDITSNDPDTPLINLPVAMTVYETLSGVDFYLHRLLHRWVCGPLTPSLPVPVRTVCLGLWVMAHRHWSIVDRALRSR